MEKLYTALEIAEQLQIKKTTVYELIKRGELKSTKIGKQIRISTGQLNEYLASSSSTEAGRYREQTSAESLLLFSTPDMAGTATDTSILSRDYLLNTSGLLISGQNSFVVETLRSGMETHPNGLPMLHSYMNSYNSLYSLYFEKIHLALISLWDMNVTDGHAGCIQELVPGIPVTVLHLCSYQEGFYVQKGNPVNIHAFKDIKNHGIHLANRERGSSSRILLDRLLCKHHMEHTLPNGYKKEYLSPLAVANAVSSKEADTGIGDQAMIGFFPQLDFIPLRTASLDMVFFTSYLHFPVFQAILDIVRSEVFKNNLKNLKGYNTQGTGNLINLP